MARFLCFAAHLGKDAGTKIALVKCGFATTDDGRDNAGKRLETTHSADGVWMLAGNITNFKRELCSGGKSVAADVHGRRARVGFLSVKGDDVALDALGAENYA